MVVVTAALIMVGLATPAAAAPGPASGDAASGRDAPVVRTTEGRLRGVSAAGADRFLGVP